MRRLHGDHIFHLPYRANDFPLAGLVAERAAGVQADRELVARIDAHYARYLEPHGALVHADVQPSNILLDGARPRLLDPEIAHIGDPAFDIGILLAHLLLHGIARGMEDAAIHTLNATWFAYAEAHGPAHLARFGDAIAYAGIELLRRTIGAARTRESQREAVAPLLIERGVALVKSPPESPEALARIA
jgi:5-methylthioribose kinase